MGRIFWGGAGAGLGHSEDKNNSSRNAVMLHTVCILVSADPVQGDTCLRTTNSPVGLQCPWGCVGFYHACTGVWHSHNKVKWWPQPLCIQLHSMVVYLCLNKVRKTESSQNKFDICTRLQGYRFQFFQEKYIWPDRYYGVWHDEDLSINTYT